MHIKIKAGGNETASNRQFVYLLWHPTLQIGETITRQAQNGVWEPTHVLLHPRTSPSPQVDASGSAHADPTGL